MNQSEQPSSKTLGERIPPAVTAAAITGLFMLMATLVSSYFPNRVKLDEMRLAATQTAESRVMTATQAAALGTFAPSPAANGSATAPALGIPPDTQATRAAVVTEAQPAPAAPAAPPTATMAETPAPTATTPPTGTPAPTATSTATVATPSPTHMPINTAAVVPTSTPAPPANTATVTTAPTQAPSPTPTATPSASPTPAGTVSAAG